MEYVIPIKKIEITERIRHNNGDLEELAKNILENGLINPITVMEKGDGHFVLIAGLRRLKACELIEQKEIRATVLSPMDAEQRIRLEFSENEMRKPFTNKEKLRYAELFTEVEKAKALKRKSEHARDGYNKDRGNCPYPEKESVKGRTKDIVAKEAGFTSRRQMERAEYLKKNRPDLLDQVDKNEKSLNKAVKEARAKEKTEKSEVFIVPENNNSPVHIGLAHPEQWKTLQMFRPIDIRPQGEGIRGADHFALMKNEIYAAVYKKYEEAVQSANIVIGSFDHMKSEFDTVLRGIQNNLDTVLAENEKLEAENKKLKERLEGI